MPVCAPLKSHTSGLQSQNVFRRTFAEDLLMLPPGTLWCADGSDGLEQVYIQASMLLTVLALGSVCQKIVKAELF